jgi:hypothetical protein
MRMPCWTMGTSGCTKTHSERGPEMAGGDGARAPLEGGRWRRHRSETCIGGAAASLPHRADIPADRPAAQGRSSPLGRTIADRACPQYPPRVTLPAPARSERLSNCTGRGAVAQPCTGAKRPSSTVAAITPNRLYLIAKKDIIALPSPASILLRISQNRRNRHFFATVECITAPFLVIFVTNRQSQMRKGKFERVATFPVRSGRSYSGTGPH